MLDPDWVYFQIPPQQMTFVTRIIEGCDYLGVVTAIDGKAGTGFIRTTPDTAPAARDVLRSLPFAVHLATYAEALAWEQSGRSTV